MITFWKRMGLAAAVGVVLVVVTGSDATERNGSYERALMLLEQGIIFEAIHELELFVAENPDHEQSRMELARTLHRVKRDRRTAEEAANVLRINPENAEARRLLTRVRIKLGRDLDRTDPAAILDYARLCSRPETYDRAGDFYRLYLKLDDAPLVHMEFAQMLYWAARYEDAKRHLEIYLESKPDDANMRRMLGRICGAMGDFGEAVTQYRLCLAARPGEIDAQLDVARALMWNGQEAEAEVLLKDIRQRSSEYETPLLLLASIARMQGRIQEEYDMFKAVLKTSPDNVVARERVAELERGSLLPISVHQKRLLANPTDADTRRKLVALYLAEERYGEAIPHLEVLNTQFPHDLETLSQLRQAREEEGRLAMVAVEALHAREAEGRDLEIERIESWVSRNPNDYKSRLRLASLIMARRDYAAAVAHFEILESMMPTDGRITEKLQRARGLMHESIDAASAPDE